MIFQNVSDIEIEAVNSINLVNGNKIIVISTPMRNPIRGFDDNS